MTKEQFTFIFETSFEIRNWFRNVSIDVAEFIACQSALETKYGTSDICRFNCNLFGMKLPKFRITSAIGESRGHALYCYPSCSIVDYFLWLEMSNFSRSSLTDLSKFRSLLAESSFNPKHWDYVKKIDSIYNTYKTLYDENTYF